MTAIIRVGGIDVLKKLSIPEKVGEDNEMHHELYLHHEELAEAFVQKTGIVSTGYDEENLKRWFDYIDSRIEEMSKGAFDSAAKKELLEMAAFLGEQIVKYRGGWWEQRVSPELERFCINYKRKISKTGKINILINILRLLIGKYLGNDRNWLEEPFYEVISERKVYY